MRLNYKHYVIGAPHHEGLLMQNDSNNSRAGTSAKPWLALNMKPTVLTSNGSCMISFSPPIIRQGIDSLRLTIPVSFFICTLRLQQAQDAYIRQMNDNAADYRRFQCIEKYQPWLQPVSHSADAAPAPP